MKERNHWTKVNCQEEAKKYKTRKDFGKLSKGAYESTRKNGWLDEICEHMTTINKPTGYWTKEKCLEAALSCKTKKEFISKFSGAYNVAKRNGWLNEICAHMETKRKPRGYWTKEKCLEAALSCKARKEFKNKFGSAYSAAQTNGWLNEMYAHMETKSKPMGYWTKERCLEAALSCKTKKEFASKFRGAHTAAKRKGWLNEICAHMERFRRS